MIYLPVKQGANMKEKEIIIDVTNKCVMKCIYCGTDSSSNGISHIDFDLFKNIICSLKDIPKTKVFLSKSEALKYVEEHHYPIVD